VIFQFVFVWNDLLVALIFIGDNTGQPAAHTGAREPGGSFGSGWQYLAAAGFLAMIVPLIVFPSLQRFFVRVISAGAVKGLTTRGGKQDSRLFAHGLAAKASASRLTIRSRVVGT